MYNISDSEHDSEDVTNTEENLKKRSSESVGNESANKKSKVRLLSSFCHQVIKTLR